MELITMELITMELITMELMIIELELVTIEIMVLVQKQWNWYKGMQVAHPIIAPTIDTKGSEKGPIIELNWIDTKGSEKGPIMVTMTMTNDSGKWQMTMTVTMTKMAKGQFLEWPFGMAIGIFVNV